MMKTSFQVFSNRFASNISQNFKIFLKYLVRSEVLLSIGNKKKKSVLEPSGPPSRGLSQFP